MVKEVVMTPRQALDELLQRYPVLVSCEKAICEAYDIMADCFADDKFLYTCGNGGSASDADHIVGELQKGFTLKRPLSDADKSYLRGNGREGNELLANKLQMGFRAISLMHQTAIYTAVGNDLGGDMGPAQQLNALGRPDDVLLGISTSGNAKNIALACQVARMRGMKIIGMTNMKGGHLAEVADVCIRVPELETFKVQELHLPVYHTLCIMVERKFFKE